jgi:hypothetical protein
VGPQPVSARGRNVLQRKVARDRAQLEPQVAITRPKRAVEPFSRLARQSLAKKRAQTMENLRPAPLRLAVPGGGRQLYL